MRSQTKQDWLLLVHLLPQKPTNLRVRVWRKLQQLGAVPIKNSVYVLPYNEKTHEDFQWLKQEIESAGGEAAVFRADSVEGATDDEIIAAFRRSRDEEYARLTAEFEGLTGALREQNRGGHLTATRLVHYETELSKLKQELERVRAIDFFFAPKHTQAIRAFERCQKVVHASQSPRKEVAQGNASQSAALALDLSEYQGRLWITRRNLHIDRLASAWLIRRFIDRRPRFRFVTEGEDVSGGIAFDMFGAEFTHHGEDCTFETMLKRFGLEKHAALKQVAEIVHDIDLKDNKFNRLEAAGVNALVLGMTKLYPDDKERLQHCSVLFDGVYALFSTQDQQEKEEDVNQRRRKSSGKSSKRKSGRKNRR